MSSLQFDNGIAWQTLTMFFIVQLITYSSNLLRTLASQFMDVGSTENKEFLRCSYRTTPSYSNSGYASDALVLYRKISQSVW